VHELTSIICNQTPRSSYLSIFIKILSIVLESYQIGGNQGLNLACIHRLAAFHFAQHSQPTVSQGCDAAILQSI